MLALPVMLFLLPIFLPETLPWMLATKLHSMFYLMPGYELSWFWENGYGGNYLLDRVSFSQDKLMDLESKAVMMAWEQPLMEAHAKAVCSGGGHILNVGFRMALVDTTIQQYNPSSHIIIEAHPEVYKRMLQFGWGEKENVKIIFGRWQDDLDQLDSYDVQVLVATQTPGEARMKWFQGNADAVRQFLWVFEGIPGSEKLESHQTNH